MEKFVPKLRGQLKQHIVDVPAIISREASGIMINGRLIKSLIFTTDVAIIRNMNADAIIAVYPFTPSPVITHALLSAADVPVFCGVGGGTTTGTRVINLATHAEYQGSIGIVLNSPTRNEIIREIAGKIDIPIVVTVVNSETDVQARLDAGTAILNISGATKTAEIVRDIRRDFPEVPIIATGGPTDETIKRTIEAGANAITYTPPTSGELFKDLMRKYREH